MANTFKNATARAIGTTATAVGFPTGVPDDSQITCIGMTCANVSSEVISVDVTLEKYSSFEQVTGLTIANAAFGLTSSAVGSGTLSATGGGGTGFAGTYTTNSSGSLDTVTITNGGSGYTSVPTIVVSGNTTTRGGVISNVTANGMEMKFTDTDHGMSINDAFRMTTTGTFPAGDSGANPTIVLAVDTNIYVWMGFDAAGEGSGFTDDTWIPSMTRADDEGGLYFENAGTGTHSWYQTASVVTATTSSASGNTDITHLVKSAPIPVGGSLVVLGGEFKLVLQDSATGGGSTSTTGNQILVKSNVASSVDVVMSYLEIT